MATKTFTNLGQAIRQIVRDTEKKENRVKAARKAAAKFGAKYVIRETVPKAFGELAQSVHADEEKGGWAVIADAPHAAAVENGSRPHMPPLEPLIAWVKLRGAQALVGVNQHAYARIRKSKDWRKSSAIWVATQLKGMEQDSSLSVDAPRQLAWAIAMAIKKRGTKPTKFMQKAVDPTRDRLQGLVEVAIRKK